MEWWLWGLFLFIPLFIFIAAGIPVGISLWLISIIAGFILWGANGLLAIASTSFEFLTHFALISLTLFILMGELVSQGTMGQKIFSALEVWFGRIPGGLAIATLLSCLIFAACTGLSPAATAMIGGVALTEMLNRGYDKRLSTGVIAGGAAVAILMPPGILMIIYASLTGESVADMFMAGVIPALLTIFLFCIYIFLRAKMNPSLAPRAEVSIVSAIDKFKRTGNIVYILFIIIAVLGSIYAGIATPSEAAAVGCLCIIILNVLLKLSDTSKFFEAILNTVRINSMIFFICLGAKMFSEILVYTGFTSNFSQMVVELPIPSILIVIMLLISLVFLGCFMDASSILFITTPIYAPVVDAMGYNLVWYGILFVISMELANITPPVGLNLYVMKGIAPSNITTEDVIAGCVPYYFLYMCTVILIIVFPQIALFVPGIN